eukprot:7391426-Prymnesium_polylepis.1
MGGNLVCDVVNAGCATVTALQLIGETDGTDGSPGRSGALYSISNRLHTHRHAESVSLTSAGAAERLTLPGPLPPQRAPDPGVPRARAAGSRAAASCGRTARGLARALAR